MNKLMLTNMYLSLGSLIVLIHVINAYVNITYELNTIDAYKIINRHIETSISKIKEYKTKPSDDIYLDFELNYKNNIKEFLYKDNKSFNIDVISDVLNQATLINIEFEKTSTAFKKIGDYSSGIIKDVDDLLEEDHDNNWNNFKFNMMTFRNNPSLTNLRNLKTALKTLNTDNVPRSIDVSTNINMIKIYAETLGFYNTDLPPFYKLENIILDYYHKRSFGYEEIFNSYNVKITKLITQLIWLIIILIILLVYIKYKIVVDIKFHNTYSCKAVTNNLRNLQAITAMSRDGFRTTLDNVPWPTCRFNVSGEILSVNEAFRKLLNINFNNIIGSSLYNIIPNLDDILEKSIDDPSHVPCKILGNSNYYLMLTVIMAPDAIHGQDEYQITILDG